MKYCKDCKYFKKTEYEFVENTCYCLYYYKPNNVDWDIVDKRGDYTIARKMRGDDKVSPLGVELPSCGANAKFYKEAKNEGS